MFGVRAPANPLLLPDWDLDIANIPDWGTYTLNTGSDQYTNLVWVATGYDYRVL